MIEPTELRLRCACGHVRGTFSAAPGVATRARCYCNDCRAYATWLARGDILDQHGGTEVAQTWPSRVRITDGSDQVRLLRLTAKGLHRWHAGCCRTPIANTLGNAWLPFVGIVTRVMEPESAAKLEGLFGPPIGVQGRFAPDGRPPGVSATAPLSVITGAISLLARGWWAGANRPHPFFDAAGAPVVAAQILTAEERVALG